MAEPLHKPTTRRDAPPTMTFGQMQQLILELPKTMNHIQEQTDSIQKLMKREVAAAQKQAQALNDQAKTSESAVALLGLIHDRLDALSIEGRVTNLLLSELVAIQRAVIAEDTDVVREGIRHDAYAQVLSAQ